MKKILVLAAATAAFVATPAMAAGEGRFEGRAGMAWAGGAEEAFAGIGAGYDFDLGEQAFAGVDLGADKVLQGGAKVLWSVGGRLGAKVGDNGKLYAVAGVGFCCSQEDLYAGVGYQHGLGEKVYGKIEYRQVFNAGSNINFAGVGVGVKF